MNVVFYFNYFFCFEEYQRILSCCNVPTETLFYQMYCPCPWYCPLRQAPWKQNKKRKIEYWNIE
jgi:hypothetical protein